LNKIQKLFQKDIKKRKIKPLSDKELHKLLVKAIKSDDEKERREARKKVIEHILPIIINRCKRYFPEDYLVENTDFINEVILLIMERLFDNFRIDEQEEGRCALFFRAMQFYFLRAYNRLKDNYFGTKDISYKEFKNWRAKENDNDYDFHKIRMIEGSYSYSGKELLDIDSWEYWAKEFSQEEDSDSFGYNNLTDTITNELSYEDNIIDNIEKKEKLYLIFSKGLSNLNLLKSLIISVELFYGNSQIPPTACIINDLNIGEKEWKRITRTATQDLQKLLS